MEQFSRRTFLGSLAALPAHGATPPNVLLITTDQQTHAALSAHGNRYLKTPAMDSLVTRGASFDRSYSSYPVCSPARSSWLTGLMPHQTGVRMNGRAIAPGIPTLGEVFQKAGYETVWGGKWHLPRSFGGVTGFRELIGGAAHGKDMDAPLSAACAKYLKAAPKKPFLLVASFMNPHDVCQWIRDHADTVKDDAPANYPPAPKYPAVDPNEPEYLRFHRTAGYNSMSEALGIASKWTPQHFRRYLHDYYRMVEAVDGEIGVVLNALNEAGLASNTLIAFTADHGEGMGEHAWVQKAAFWEAPTRVPLVFAGAGIPARRGVRTLASSIDLMPTLCDYAGVPIPGGVVGQSLRPAIEGRAINRDFIVSELSEYGGKQRQGRMLRSERYKYVVFNGGANREQLFDLQTDPGENVNLVNKPGAPADAHRRMLRDWMRAAGDDFGEV